MRPEEGATPEMPRGLLPESFIIGIQDEVQTACTFWLHRPGLIVSTLTAHTFMRVEHIVAQGEATEQL